MNDFFDCTNVRSLTEHVKKRNEFIKPYTSADDDRFGWLVDVFIQYLESWKASAHEREGDFSDDARGKMFLSMQTYEGLKISVFSHVEEIKFLLENGFKYVLSERFMQDVLEDYFGHQRSKGRRADNPSAYEFDYNYLTIAAQRDIAPVVRGNVGGRYEKKKWFAVSDEPVQKRKKNKYVFSYKYTVIDYLLLNLLCALPYILLLEGIKYRITKSFPWADLLGRGLNPPLRISLTPLIKCHVTPAEARSVAPLQIFPPLLLKK